MRIDSKSHWFWAPAGRAWLLVLGIQGRAYLLVLGTGGEHTAAASVGSPVQPLLQAEFSSQLGRGRSYTVLKTFYLDTDCTFFLKMLNCELKFAHSLKSLS